MQHCPNCGAAEFKIMEAGRLRDGGRELTGRVELDDACLGGERSGDKPGRGSENRVLFVAALVQATSSGKAFLACLRQQPHTEDEVAVVAASHIAPSATVVSDGLWWIGATPIVGIELERHPSLAGTYLAACTVMASVYKRNPVGNRYTAGLPADVAAHLQAVAWETAQAFHAKEGRGSL